MAMVDPGNPGDGFHVFRLDADRGTYVSGHGTMEEAIDAANQARDAALQPADAWYVANRETPDSGYTITYV